MGATGREPELPQSRGEAGRAERAAVTVAGEQPFACMAPCPAGAVVDSANPGCRGGWKVEPVAAEADLGAILGSEIAGVQAGDAVGADAVDGDQDDGEPEPGIQVGVGEGAVEHAFVLGAEAATDLEVESFVGRRDQVPIGVRGRAPAQEAPDTECVRGCRRPHASTSAWVAVVIVWDRRLRNAMKARMRRSSRLSLAAWLTVVRGRRRRRA